MIRNGLYQSKEPAKRSKAHCKKEKKTMISKNDFFHNDTSFHKEFLVMSSFFPILENLFFVIFNLYEKVCHNM